MSSLSGIIIERVYFVDPFALHVRTAGGEAGGGLQCVRRESQGSHVRQEGGIGGEEEES